MVPSLTKGFSDFLQSQWKELWHIQKLKFKKITQWDLVVSVFPQEQEDSKGAPVLGEFTDTEGRVYYFYSHEKSFKSGQRKLNILPFLLLLDLKERGAEEFNKTLEGDVINVPFVAMKEQYKDSHELPRKAMEQNNWYIAATILDMMNIVMVSKLGWWVIMSYENIRFAANFALDDFSHGSYHLQASAIGDPRPLKEALGYKWKCEVLDDKGGVVFSADIIFRIPTRPKELT